MTDILRHFNSSIDTWIEILNDHSFENLIKHPIPGSWSLGQVFMHLIEDTTWHVEQMSAALKTEENSEEVMHDNAKWMFDHNKFPNIQIEGAATIDNVPEPVSKESILQHLLTIRAEVNRLCETHDLAKSTGKIRHPGLLYFSALDWLRFTEMHMRHHLRQKDRIESALKLV